MGGRWNSPGRPLLYASSHLSLAVLEALVHLDPGELPDDSVAFELRVRSGMSESIEPERLPEGWRTDPSRASTRAIGDAWLEAARSVVLLVPSAVVPQERNVLLDPEHPAFRKAVRVVGRSPFRFDPRLASA